MKDYIALVTVELHKFARSDCAGTSGEAAPRYFDRAGGYLILLGVIGANMGRKLFVALQLEVSHHFIERRAGQCFSRFEPPATFRTTKTPKTLLLNPHQLPAHGGQILQAVNLDGLSCSLQRCLIFR